MDELLTNFKNLGGATIGEHKKNYNAFCRKLDTLSEEEVNLLLLGINPTNIQEKIFFVHLLGRFKKTEELYNIIYQNNIVLNKIILRSYSQLLLQDLQAKKFVEEVCPNISFSMRKMIINKLSNQITDTKIADDFFNQILRKYDIKTAETILICCSNELIENTLEEYKINFRCKVLIRLYKKSTELLLKYLRKDFRQTYSNNLEVLLRYLAENDIDTFHGILEENIGFLGVCKLNLKGFINLITKFREFYIKEASHFHNLLPNSTWTFKYLSREEFMRFLKNCLCPDDQYYSALYTFPAFLEKVPIKERGAIIFENYKQVFHKNIWDKNVLANYELDRILPLLSMEDKMKFPLTLDKHLPFCNTKEAFEFVKQKLNLTQDIYARMELFSNLIRNCKINNDYFVLSELLKYFCKRHKNDIILIRQDFLQKILETFGNTLNEEHWIHINEQILNFKTREEPYNCESIYLETYIHFKIKNNMDFTNELIDFIKMKQVGNSWRLLVKYPHYEKICLLKMRGVLDQSFKKEEMNGAKSSFLKTLLEWNQQHPRKQFDLYDYPDCIDALISVAQESEDIYYATDIFFKIFSTKNPNHYLKRDMYLEVFIKETDKVVCEELMSWLIKHNPGLVQKYFDRLIKKSGFMFPFYEISKMHFNGLADLFRTKSVDLLNTESDEIAEKILALKYLSYGDDFLEQVKRYIIPEEGNCVIDVYKTEAVSFLRIQREVLQAFKNCLTPNTNLQTVLKFCAADYLQYALHPLYFIVYNTPEKDLLEPLRILSNRSVSVRKHSTFLAAKFSPKLFVQELFTQMCTSEKNISVRKYLLKTIHKYFCDNQNDDMFTLFCKQVSLVPKEDTESLTLFVDWRRIPRKYLAKYVVLIWNHVKTFERDMKFKLIDAFDEEIFKCITDDFSEPIIDYCLFNSDNPYQSSIEKFVYNYIRFGVRNIEDRAHFVIKKILDYKPSIVTYDDYSEVHSKFKSLICEICSNLMEETKDRSKLNALREVSSTLLKVFENSITEVSFTEQKLLLRVTDLYIQLPEDNMESVCKLIVDMQEDVSTEYGSTSFYLYGSIINTFINSLIQKDNNTSKNEFICKIIKMLLENTNSTQMRLICILLLPNNVELAKDKELLCQVMDIIKLNSDPIVEVYLHIYRVKGNNPFY